MRRHVESPFQRDSQATKTIARNMFLMVRSRKMELRQANLTANTYHHWYQQPLALAILAFAGLVTLISYISFQGAYTPEAGLSLTSEIPFKVIELLGISIITGFVLIFLLYQAHRKHEKRLAWQATHDALTGLLNRDRIETIVAEVSSSKSIDQACALFYIDLDHFKLINDTIGHNAGDELLRQIAGLLTKHLNANQTLSRLGGDEFSFLVTDIDSHTAKILANELLDGFTNFRFSWSNQSYEVSASIGVVMFKGQQMSKTELFSAADLACQMAKDTGRNGFHLYQSSDNETITRLNVMHWATKLHVAMFENNLQIFHQPIMTTNNQFGVGRTEVLLRYLEDGKNPVSAIRMIEAAEKYGLTNSLDEYVFNKVLAYMKEHSSDDMIYNINISGRSLESPHMLGRFVTMINRYGIEPGKICFEITETMAITRYSNARQFIHILQEMGCKFALDDFGTGASSFGYLDKLPVNMIKIDGSFIKTLHVDDSSRAICLAIREVAKAFDIKVVAEGVENDTIRHEVERLGIDYVQGFGIVMPSPLERMAA